MLEIRQQYKNKEYPEWVGDSPCELTHNVKRIWVRGPSNSKKSFIDLINTLGKGKKILFFHTKMQLSEINTQYQDTKLYLEDKKIPNYFHYGGTSTFSRLFGGKGYELKWFAVDCVDGDILNELFSKYVTGLLHTFFLIHEKDFSEAMREVDSILVNWPNGFSDFVVNNYCFIYDDKKWYDEEGYYLSFFSAKITDREMEAAVNEINRIYKK
jgi:hypothetical protein